MEDGAVADRTLVAKALVDTGMVCYGVLEPEIEEYNSNSSSNDGSVDERNSERFDQQLQQQHPLSSQQSSSDSINPSSHDDPTPFSQQSTSGFWSSQDEPSRMSQELLAYKKVMDEWESQWKETVEEEKREFEEEVERKDREYLAFGFDTREEEMKFRKEREKERRKSLL